MKKTLFLLCSIIVLLCSCNKEHLNVERTYSDENSSPSISCISQNINYNGSIFGGSALTLNDNYYFSGSSETCTKTTFFLSFNKNEANEYSVDLEDSTAFLCQPDKNGCYIMSCSAEGKTFLSFADFSGHIIKSTECTNGEKISVSKDSVYIQSFEEDNDISLYVYDKDLNLKDSIDISQFLVNENEEILEIAIDRDNNYYALIAYNSSTKKNVDEYKLKISSFNTDTKNLNVFKELDTNDYKNLRICKDTISVDYTIDNCFSTIRFNQNGIIVEETDFRNNAIPFDNEFCEENSAFTADGTCIFHSKENTTIIDISDNEDTVAIACSENQTKLKLDILDYNETLIESDEIILPDLDLRISELMTVFEDNIVWYAYGSYSSGNYLIYYNYKNKTVKTIKTDLIIKDFLMPDKNHLLFIKEQDDQQTNNSVYIYDLTSDRINTVTNNNNFNCISLCFDINNNITVLGTDEKSYSISYITDEHFSSPEIISDLNFDSHNENIYITQGKQTFDFFITTESTVYGMKKNSLHSLVQINKLNGICETKKIFPVSESTFYILGMDYYNYSTGAYKISTINSNEQKVLKISADDSVKSNITNIISKYNTENETIAAFTEINDLAQEYPDIYFHALDTDISRYLQNNMLSDLRNIEKYHNQCFIYPTDSESDAFYSFIPSYSLVSEQPNTDRTLISEYETIENMILNCTPLYIDMEKKKSNFSCDDFYSKLKQIKMNKNDIIFKKYHTVNEILQDINILSDCNNYLIPDYSISVFNTSDKKDIDDFLTYFTESNSSDHASEFIKTHQMDGIPNNLSYYNRLLEKKEIYSNEYTIITSLLKNTVVIPEINKNINEIVSEETNNYLSGNADEVDTAKKIDNKISLYFKERT